MENINNLKKEKLEIEKELQKAEKNMENIGSLAIRIQKFVKLIDFLKETSDDIKILKNKASEFNKRILHLSNLRLRKRHEENEEMIKCRLVPETPFTECTEEINSNDTYFTERTQNVNNILTGAIDVLDQIKRQGQYIDRAGSRIKGGLLKLGVSKELVREIDRIYIADNRIFITGFVFVIILFILLRFFFK